MTRTAADISNDLDTALAGRADIDAMDVIGELVDDVLDSVRLALSEHDVGQAVIDDVVATVRDYATNHYF